MPVYKNYNKDFFKTWSPDMAYVLGFLYADGNIIKTKRGTHFIAFYSADEDIIFGMRKTMRLQHKVSVRTNKSGKMFKIQVGSKEWFEDLNKIGLIPNKVKRMTLPNVPNSLAGDFIRGYFDGDGNIWMGFKHKERKNPYICLQVVFTSCSFDFLYSLHRLLLSLGLRGGSLYRHKRKNYSRLSFSTGDALKLRRIMYNSSCGIFIARKKVIFEKFRDMRL